MNLLKATLVGCIASLALTSCLGTGDEPNQTISYSLKYNYSYVTDLTDDSAEPLLLAGGEYLFNYNATKRTVTVTVENLQLSATGARYGFEINDQPFTMTEEGSILIKVANAVSGNSDLTISDFVVRQIGVGVNESQNAMYYDISYVVNGKWSVRVLQRNNIFAGKLTTTKLDSTDKPVVSYESNFGYALDLEKKKAILAITAVRYNNRYFSEINFSDLTYTVDGLAVKFIPGENIRALDYAGNPISDFDVTNFNAYLTFSSELVMNFEVNYESRISCIGTYRNVKEDDM